MPFIRRQAPARAALLIASMLMLACNGNPAATEAEVSTSGTKKTSKATPRPGASAPNAGGDTTPTATPSTAASSPNGASTAPTTSTAPSSAVSTAPSTAVSTAPVTSAAPSSGGSGGGASPVTSTAPTSATSTAPSPLAQQATPAPGAVIVGTYAGTDTAGFEDGAVATATFNGPRGLAVHPGTGDVYVADSNNHVIRKIAGGQVTTVIGTGEATTPQDTKTLNRPEGVAVMADGTLLIADSLNNRIRKLPVAEAAKELVARELDFVVGSTTGGFADGVADASRMQGPTGIALTADQNFLWVVDSGNNCIRIVDLAADRIDTVAGSATETGDADGSGTTARFNNPNGCAAVGNDTLYVVDAFNSKLRKIVKSGNAVTVSTVASATLSFITPSDVIAAGSDPEAAGGSLLIADSGRLSIQRLAGGELSAVDLIPGNTAGFADGGTDSAQFRTMADMIVLPDGAILVADPDNHRIRKLSKP